MISSKAGIIGKLVIGMVRFVWSVATYFVVPIIAFERLSPFQAIKRSKDLLKSTWGEALISNLGIGLIFILVALTGFIPLIIGVAIGSTPAIIGIAIAVIFWIGLALVASAVFGVPLAALYRYGTTGKLSEYYPERVLQNPWNL